LKLTSTISALITTLLLASFAVSAITMPGYAAVPPGGTLNPLLIPKFVNQLVIPPVYVPDAVAINTTTGKVIGEHYTVDMSEFYEQILPPFDINGLSLPMTKVWGYGGLAKNATTGLPMGYFHFSPGPTFNATMGVHINVTWINNINVFHSFPVDPTLHWANPNGINMTRVMELAMQGIYPMFPPGYNGSNTVPGNPEGYNAQYPVPLIPHLHGGEVQSTFDGHPEAWFTWNGMNGSAYNTAIPTAPGSAVFHYPNMQPPTTLWYHDHALGITRINVASGLAGFYLLRNPADTIAPLLPSGQYEIPLAIQDRSFNLDGSMWFPSLGLNPMDHPYWMPEFFGNTIMVNGKVWPNLNVKQGQYRFRLLDGSNARFYTISFWDMTTNLKLPFIQIGSDGGYLQKAAVLKELTIAPGERADILVNFSGLAGHKIMMKNSAKSPYPAGAPPDQQTVAQIMQFTVTTELGLPPAVLPANLNPTLPGNVFPTLLGPINKTRILTLWEVMGMMGPTEILLNGQKWAGATSEKPYYGKTEEWAIVNPTADTHPIHLHLVQFQLVSRQAIDVKKYAADWIAKQTDTGLYGTGMPPWNYGYIPNELPIGPYLKGKPSPAPPNERGWKDTIQMNPGEVTIIRVRFAPIDGTPNYPFNPTVGPGYVWHCHILDHEDNEMMRPYKVANP